MEITLASKLSDLMGYVQNSSEITLKLYQDDATRTYHMKAISYNGNELWSEFADSIQQLINKAWDKHGLDYCK